MIEILRGSILTLLMLNAVVSDLKYRKIPNRLTVTFALIGLGFHIITDFPQGIFTSLLGFVVGFFIFLIPYLMKGMGAGDVKLMASIGAITNWRTIISVGLYAAIAGGVIVLLLKIKSGGLKNTIVNTGKLLCHYFYGVMYSLTLLPTMKYNKDKYQLNLQGKRDEYIPYAVAIAIGCIVSIILYPQGLSQ